MEITDRGKIKCKFGDLTVIDCQSLQSEDCDDCIMYKIRKDIIEEDDNPNE